MTDIIVPGQTEETLQNDHHQVVQIVVEESPEVSAEVHEVVG